MNSVWYSHARMSHISLQEGSAEFVEQPCAYNVLPHFPDKDATHHHEFDLILTFPFFMCYKRDCFLLNKHRLTSLWFLGSAC